MWKNQCGVKHSVELGINHSTALNAMLNASQVLVDPGHDMFDFWIQFSLNVMQS